MSAVNNYGAISLSATGKTGRFTTRQWHEHRLSQLLTCTLVLSRLAGQWRTSFIHKSCRPFRHIGGTFLQDMMTILFSGIRGCVFSVVQIHYNCRKPPLERFIDGLSRLKLKALFLKTAGQHCGPCLLCSGIVFGLYQMTHFWRLSRRTYYGNF